METNEEIIENEFTVESVIVNNYKRAHYYFPRLSKYLMEKTSTMNLTNINAFKQHQYLQYFLYFLCSRIELNDDYVKCIDYISERLVEEPMLNKSYLDFKDGYLHNKDYNEALVMQTIADSGYEFESFFIELEEETDGRFNFTVFRSLLVKIFTKLIKSCAVDEPINSNEYYEICFMNSALNTLQLGIEAEEGKRSCEDWR